jgi:hypothetical protein
MKHVCPVCNFPALTEAPRSQSGGGSFEICPSCGFQFGVSDDDGGFTYAKWRTAWKKSGMKWSSRQAPPKNWDAAAQLGRLPKKKSGGA